jgi:hypothetical protein
VSKVVLRQWVVVALAPLPDSPVLPIARDMKCIYLFCGNFSLENACFVCTFCTSNFFAGYETYVGNNVGWIGIFVRALDNCHGIQCIPIHLFPIAIWKNALVPFYI